MNRGDLDSNICADDFLDRSKFVGISNDCDMSNIFFVLSRITDLSYNTTCVSMVALTYRAIQSYLRIFSFANLSSPTPDSSTLHRDAMKDGQKRSQT